MTDPYVLVTASSRFSSISCDLLAASRSITDGTCIASSLETSLSKWGLSTFDPQHHKSLAVWTEEVKDGISFGFALCINKSLNSFMNLNFLKYYGIMVKSMTM